VPEMIEEDDFWRNYFYKIECVLAEMGLDNVLGDKIDERVRA